LHQQLDIPVLYATHAQQEVAQLADGEIDCLPADILTRLDMPIVQDKEQAGTVW
jgi:molybdate transport system ATP-binding protein